MIKNGKFTDENGVIVFYKDGIIHRDDGPAVIWPDNLPNEKYEHYLNFKYFNSNSMISYEYDNPDNPGEGGDLITFKETFPPKEILVDKNYSSGFTFQKVNDFYKYEDVPPKYHGGMAWLKDGELHNENSPAIVLNSGSIFWLKNGLLHRDNDKPAIEYVGDWGTRQEFFIYGERHRENNPAIIEPCGIHYFKNNEYHNENGPAITMEKTGNIYYLEGKELTEENFKYYKEKKDFYFSMENKFSNKTRVKRKKI